MTYRQGSALSAGPATKSFGSIGIKGFEAAGV